MQRYLRVVVWAGLAVACLLTACASTANSPDLAGLSPVANPRDVPEPPAQSCSRIDAYMTTPEQFVFIDARSTEEFSVAHVAGAVNIPYDRLAEFADALPTELEQPIVAYCRSGRRATLLRKSLQQLGYTRIEVVPGGQIETGALAQRFVCSSGG
jgi:rhodanese-related sulfurtransferase